MSDFINQPCNPSALRNIPPQYDEIVFHSQGRNSLHRVFRSTHGLPAGGMFLHSQGKLFTFFVQCDVNGMKRFSQLAQHAIMSSSMIRYSGPTRCDKHLDS